MRTIELYHCERVGVLNYDKKEHVLINNRIGDLNIFFKDIFLNQEVTKTLHKELIDKIYKYIKSEKLVFDFKNELYQTISKLEKPILNKIFFELCFEEYRRKNFPSKPSRMKAIYLSETEEEVNMWIKRLKNIKGIFKFTFEDNESNIHFEADSNFFEKCKINDVDSIDIYAEEYWKGNSTSNPIKEILVVGKLRYSCISQ